LRKTLQPLYWVLIFSVPQKEFTANLLNYATKHLVVNKFHRTIVSSTFYHWQNVFENLSILDRRKRKIHKYI